MCFTLTTFISISALLTFNEASGKEKELRRAGAEKNRKKVNGIKKKHVTHVVL
jgi:hypothetical protein